MPLTRSRKDHFSLVPWGVLLLPEIVDVEAQLGHDLSPYTQARNPAEQVVGAELWETGEQVFSQKRGCR